eukprot:SAG11_NODE_7283_length_1166_cov_2.432990_2_plen_36_part_01
MKVKRVLERNLENRKKYENLSIQVGQPFRRERFERT